MSEPSSPRPGVPLGSRARLRSWPPHRPGPEAPPPSRRRWDPAAALALVVLVAALWAAGSVAWELWGSNWWASRHPAPLAENPALIIPDNAVLAPPPRDEIADLLAQVGEGGRLGTITIPRINLDVQLVRGTGTGALKGGPGWMEGTAFPGEPGNAVVSGHRTTWGAPFRHLDALRPGDRIYVSVTGRDTAVYEMAASKVVDPHDVSVVAPTTDSRLTLTTCHPPGSDRSRLIIVAERVLEP